MERLRAIDSLHTTDALIAAILLNRHLTMVTRNMKDITRIGVPILNPRDNTNQR